MAFSDTILHTTQQWVYPAYALHVARCTGCDCSR